MGRTLIIRVRFCSGSVTIRVLFGSIMSVFLHCKIAYSTLENVCFALLNRTMYLNLVMSTLLQSSLLVLHKSCLPVHATHITNMGSGSRSTEVRFGFFIFLHMSSSSVWFFKDQ